MGWLGAIGGAFGGAQGYLEKDRARKDALRKTLMEAAPDLHSVDQVEAFAKGMDIDLPRLGVDPTELAGMGMEREGQRFSGAMRDIAGMDIDDPVLQSGDISHIKGAHGLTRRDPGIGTIEKHGPVKPGHELTPFGEYDPQLYQAIEDRKAGLEAKATRDIEDAGRQSESEAMGAGRAQIDLGMNPDWKQVMEDAALRQNRAVTREYFEPVVLPGTGQVVSGMDRAQSMGDINRQSQRGSFGTKMLMQLPDGTPTTAPQLYQFNNHTGEIGSHLGEAQVTNILGQAISRQAFPRPGDPGYEAPELTVTRPDGTQVGGVDEAFTAWLQSFEDLGMTKEQIMNQDVRAEDSHGGTEVTDYEMRLLEMREDMPEYWKNHPAYK